MNITKIVLIALMVVMGCSFGGDPFGQQAGQAEANFQGAFDSTEYDQQEGYDDYDIYDEEEADMIQFSENLGQFIPDETFTFKMPPYSQQKFAIWPGARVQTVRGMFHCQVDWDQQENYDSGYINLEIMDGDTIVRQFKSQRLGVFKQPHNLKDNKFHFIFRSHQSPVQVYFSYQMLKSSKSSQSVQSNTTDMERVLQSFTKVSNLLLQQQKQMSRLMQLASKHTNRVKAHLDGLWWRGIFEGIAILMASGVSLGMLRRQIYRQYQSLV